MVAIILQMVEEVRGWWVGKRGEGGGWAEPGRGARGGEMAIPGFWTQEGEHKGQDQTGGVCERGGRAQGWLRRGWKGGQ